MIVWGAGRDWQDWKKREQEGLCQRGWIEGVLVLAILLVCATACGQTVVSGRGRYSGAGASGAVASMGGPLAYNSRWDACVSPALTPGATVTGMAVSGSGPYLVTLTFNPNAPVPSGAQPLFSPGAGQLIFLTGSGWNSATPYTVLASPAPSNTTLAVASATNPSNAPAAAEYCNSMATGQPGSTLVFQDGASDPLPNGFSYCGYPTSTGCTSQGVLGQAESHVMPANSSWTDPDFGSYGVWVTDITTNNASGTNANSLVMTLGSDTFNQNDTMLVMANAGGVSLFEYINATAFRNHQCAPGSQSTWCFWASQIKSGGCPAQPCTNTQLQNNVGTPFSHNASDSPYTIYEIAATYLNKNTINPCVLNGTGTNSQSLTGNCTTGTDVLTCSGANCVNGHKKIVDFTSDSPTPCSVLPASYQSTWLGIAAVGDDGSVTVLSGGGGDWSASTAVTTDSFIRPQTNSTPATLYSATFNSANNTATLYVENYTLGTTAHVAITGAKPSSGNWNGEWAVTGTATYTTCDSPAVACAVITVTVPSGSGLGSYTQDSGQLGYANAMYQALGSGTTGTTAPNWMENCQGQGDVCGDNTVAGGGWVNIGNVGGQGPGFDIMHYDPARGCARFNTRTGRVYYGTGWPSQPAGGWANALTDDAATVLLHGGTAGGTVQFPDRFTLHDGGQHRQGIYSVASPTGGGSFDNNWQDTNGDNASPSAHYDLATQPTGSCLGQTINHSASLYGGAIENAAWQAGKVGNGQYSYYGGIWWKALSANSTVAPSLGDAASGSPHYAIESGDCYNYQFEWDTMPLMVRPSFELGPDYGADGHNAVGKKRYYKGGPYWSHDFNAPNCQSANDARCTYPGGNYTGAPAPGWPLLPGALCNDGHPLYNNGDDNDDQPILDATASVPGWGGASQTAACTSINQTACSRYTCAGYTEEVSFLNVTAPVNQGQPQTMNRFAHSFTTGSSPGYNSQNGIAGAAQLGDILATTTDGENTRGDGVSGATLCGVSSSTDPTAQGPLRAMYQWQKSSTVTLNDTMFVLSSGGIYQATGCGANIGGTGTTCTTGSSAPVWGATLSGTTVDDAGEAASAGVVWAYVGKNSCRSDIMATHLQ